MTTNELVWETQDYYHKARNGSLDIDHPGMKLVAKLANGSKEILDLGCGEGTRLSLITKKGVGIDISKTAISLAKKRHHGYKFVVGSIEKTPFKNATFDLIYSAFVFEHVRNPELVIKEVKRILQPKGNFVIICPNFGAPNRASPPYIGSRIKKLLLGTVNDLMLSLKPVVNLDWNKVTPLSRNGSYKMDWDTTIEPYSLSLEKYLNSNGFRVIRNISTWRYESESAMVHQRIFRLLGNLGIYPYSYWSPHIVIFAKKI